MGKWFHFCDLNYADWLDQQAVGILTRCLGIPNEEQCCRQSECDQRLVFPCFGDEIVYSGKNCLEKCKFGIESQEEEHEEEEEGPKGWNSEKTDSFRVSDKRKTLSRFDNIFNVLHAELTL